MLLKFGILILLLLVTLAAIDTPGSNVDFVELAKERKCNENITDNK